MTDFKVCDKHISEHHRDVSFWSCRLSRRYVWYCPHKHVDLHETLPIRTSSFTLRNNLVLLLEVSLHNDCLLFPLTSLGLIALKKKKKNVIQLMTKWPWISVSPTAVSVQHWKDLPGSYIAYGFGRCTCKYGKIITCITILLKILSDYTNVNSQSFLK